MRAFTPEGIAVCSTDASSTGYGAHWGPSERMAGRFKTEEKSWHINHKELWTIVHAIRVWGKYWRGRRVLFLCDNKTAVACVNKRSSAKSHLQGLCEALEYWAGVFQCEVRAAWIPGRLNTLADSLSREKCAVHSADYQLLQTEFDRWNKRFGPHEVDAFADDVGQMHFARSFGQRRMVH